MSTYLDTTALLKLYVVDSGSAQVQQLAHEAERLVLCPVQLLELRLALQDLERAGLLQAPAVQATLKNFEEDLRMGLFHLADPDWEEVWREANTLAQAQARVRPAGIMDYLQVAIARSLEASFFVSGDPRQADLAREAGLPVVLVGA